MAIKQEESAPVVILKTYDFLLWLLPKIESFPKHYKFSVGERLTANGLDLLTILLEAAYVREKESLLRRASTKVNIIRTRLRLAKDWRVLSIDAYGFSAGLVDEIGRMVGGWQKSTAKV